MKKIDFYDKINKIIDKEIPIKLSILLKEIHTELKEVEISKISDISELIDLENINNFKLESFLFSKSLRKKECIKNKNYEFIITFNEDKKSLLLLIRDEEYNSSFFSYMYLESGEIIEKYGTENIYAFEGSSHVFLLKDFNNENEFNRTIKKYLSLDENWFIFYVKISKESIVLNLERKGLNTRTEICFTLNFEETTTSSFLYIQKEEIIKKIINENIDKNKNYENISEIANVIESIAESLDLNIKS